MTINLGVKPRPRTDWSLFYPLPPADMLNCLALLMSVWCKDYLFTLHQENKSFPNYANNPSMLVHRFAKHQISHGMASYFNMS